MSITHRFVSAKADPADASLVGASKWNDDHNYDVDAAIIGGRIGATPNRYYVAGMIGGTALTTLALTANTIWGIPFVPSRDCSLDTILLEVTTLGSGSSARVGIYSGDGNLHPNALLAESSSGAISTATAGVKVFSFSTPVVLKGGTTYWLAVTNNATAPTVRAVPVAAGIGILGFSSTLGAVSPGFCWRATFTFAALPSTFPTASEAIIAAIFPALAARFV